MTDYKKLVEALRLCADRGGMVNCNTICEYGWKDSYGCKNILMTDAADAIEKLKDEPWVESVQVDKLRQRIDELEETACHCNVRENAELIAKILDDDVDGKAFELPKRGEWIHKSEFDYIDTNDVNHNHFMCDKCGFIKDFIDGHTAQYKYCPNCGAKMEVQDDRK